MVIGGDDVEGNAREFEIGLSGHEYELRGWRGVLGARAGLHLPLQTRWIERGASLERALLGREDVQDVARGLQMPLLRRRPLWEFVGGADEQRKAIEELLDRGGDCQKIWTSGASTAWSRHDGLYNVVRAEVGAEAKRHDSRCE